MGQAERRAVGRQGDREQGRGRGLQPLVLRAVHRRVAVPEPGDQVLHLERHDDGVPSPAVPNSIWNDAWHLLVGTYDGANVRLYVDGAEVGPGTPATGNIAYGLAAHNDLLIGGFNDPACFEQTNFDGYIDDPRVYGRALTAAEIAGLADPLATSPPDVAPDVAPPPPPTPAPAPRLPSAEFAVTTPNPRAFEATTLDASGSNPGSDVVQSYNWDLTADGKTDVSCGAQTPVLTTNTLASNVRSIGLTLAGAGGTIASVSQAIAIPRIALPAPTAAAIRATGTTRASAARPSRVACARPRIRP